MTLKWLLHELNNFTNYENQCIHASTHTHVHIHTDKQTHTHMHTHKHTNMRTCASTCTRVHTYTQTHTYTHTQTHLHAHKHTYTHTYTHTNTYILYNYCDFLPSKCLQRSLTLWWSSALVAKAFLRNIPQVHSPTMWQCRVKHHITDNNFEHKNLKVISNFQKTDFRKND